MEAFGIIGMSFGVMALGVGVMGLNLAKNALAKISKLEKQLKETGILDKVGTMVSEPPSIRFFEKIDA